METTVFEKTYRDYLEKVAAADIEERAERLGIFVSDNRIEIPLYNRIFTVTPEGIEDPEGNRPHHAISVILCQYLLLCPDHPAEDDALATFKDFKDAAPYVGGFKNTAERPIARQFTGRITVLDACSGKLGAKPYRTEVSCQLALAFPALPRVPVYLLFNDEDEEFPADCTLLFEKSAEAYLDMECLAMLGSILAGWLK